MQRALLRENGETVQLLWKAFDAPPDVAENRDRLLIKDELMKGAGATVSSKMKSSCRQKRAVF